MDFFEAQLMNKILLTGVTSSGECYVSLYRYGDLVHRFHAIPLSSNCLDRLESDGTSRAAVCEVERVE